MKDANRPPTGKQGRTAAVAGALILCSLLWPTPDVSGQDVTMASATHSDLTFTRDIAPILQENCQVCHQAGAIGPMSLMTYDDVRRYARRISRVVESRDMPPYQYDADVGIQDLKEDWRLSEEHINTITEWVAAGATEGDPADLPEPVEWPDPAEFKLADRFGEPDVIVRSDPYAVPAVGQDRWWRPVVPTGITEDRCIMAIENQALGRGTCRRSPRELIFSGERRASGPTIRVRTGEGRRDRSGRRLP